MAKKELVNINVRIPRTLKEAIEKYVKKDFHTNLSEFTREALREKIQRDYPQIFEEIFKEAENEGN